MPTTAGGNATIPLPIPNATALSGLVLHVQGGAFDPGGAVGLVSLTPGVRLVVGD